MAGGSGAKIVVAILLLAGLGTVAAVGSYTLMAGTSGDGASGDAALATADAGGDNAAVLAADGEPTAPGDADADAEAAGDGDAAAAEGAVPEGGEIGEEADMGDGDTGAEAATSGSSAERIRAHRANKGKAAQKVAKAKSRPPTAAAVARAEAARKKKKAPNNAECASRLASGVQPQGGDRYTISRGFFDKYLMDLDRAQKQGSAGWANSSSGSRLGVRIRHLKCAPRAAGLRNKDVVAEVSGHKITSSANAWLAYRDVKKGESFEIKVLRKGSPRTLKYTIGAVTPPAPEGSAEGAADAPAEGAGEQGANEGSP